MPTTPATGVWSHHFGVNDLKIGLEKGPVARALLRSGRCRDLSSALGRYGVGMVSPWQFLGAHWAVGSWLARHWGTSHRLTAKQQRGSESGFHAFGERSFVLLGVQQRPQPKLAKMWTKVWTGGPTRSSRQRPTSVTAWQPAPTTDGSRTNQNVCFAVRAA